jgi:hypothetical protein
MNAKADRKYAGERECGNDVYVSCRKQVMEKMI